MASLSLPLKRGPDSSARNQSKRENYINPDDDFPWKLKHGRWVSLKEATFFDWTARREQSVGAQMLIKHRPMIFYGGLYFMTEADIRNWRKKTKVGSCEYKGQREGGGGGGEGCREKEKRELYNVVAGRWVQDNK